MIMGSCVTVVVNVSFIFKCPAVTFFAHTVQCQVVVSAPKPFAGYVVGGTTVSLAVSDPCSLASDDILSCAFGQVVVPATQKDVNSATCVVPSLNASGTVDFEFRSVSKTKGNYTIRKHFEACKSNFKDSIKQTPSEQL